MHNDSENQYLNPAILHRSASLERLNSRNAKPCDETPKTLAHYYQNSNLQTH